MNIAGRVFFRSLSFAYSAVMHVRNMLYDAQLIETHKFAVPVVSVGNLTWGGTGKTPIICELVRWSLEQGFKPAVISRGYKGQFKGVLRVPIDGEASVYGDEPAMMAKRFGSVPVYVGGDRVAVMKELLAKESVQIIFADDAFQHRRLARALDVVVMDCTEKLEHYEVVPLGRGREEKSALKRADFIILNKVNIAPPEAKQQTLDFIDRICEGREIPVIESEYYIKRLVRLDGHEETGAGRFQKVLLASGIGNPAAFSALVAKNFDIKGHMIFRDHHIYSASDIRNIIAEARRLGVDKILVTEKDAVKIRHLAIGHLLFYVAELGPKLSLRVKGLYEKILSRLR